MKDILDKVSDEVSKGQIMPLQHLPTKDQEDNGRFISKYFDTVNNKQYQQMFCSYNQTMFAKVKIIKLMRVLLVDVLYED